MIDTTDRRFKYVVGATGGVVVGGAGSAAVGYGLTRVAGVVAGTRTVQSAASRFSAAAPNLARILPRVGTVGLIALTGYGIYQALKPVVAHAQAARKKSATTPEEDPKSLDREREKLGAKFGGYDRRLDLAIEDAKQKAESKAYSQATRDWWRTRELSLRTERENYKPGAAPAASAQPPTAAPGTTIWQDLRSVLDSKPDPAIEARRKDLLKKADTFREAVAIETKGKGGFGPRAEKAAAELAKVEGELRALDKEVREANPLRKGFDTFAPIGAALGGVALGGGWLSGVGKLKAAAQDTARGVESIGRQAGAILKSRPNGIIAGTPAGDKGKALVNEAYARGGAKPAFPSPGYPASTQTTQQLFAQSGRPRGADYALPALNAAAAAASITASIYDPNENRRSAERLLGGFEAGLAIGQWKALAVAQAVRPAAYALSAIEGLRNRIVRETATRSPAGVARSRAATNLEVARINAGRATATTQLRADMAVKGEAIRGQGRVAAARQTSQLPVIRAGADAGVAKANGAGRVSRAENRNKLGPEKYKNTWQDSRGRVYTRRDYSVRTAKRTVH